MNVFDIFIDEIIEKSDIHTNFIPLDREGKCNVNSYNLPNYNEWLMGKMMEDNKNPEKIIIEFWKGLKLTRPDIWWEENAVDYKVN